MRRDKIVVVRIILLLSIVNVALAAPAVVRQGHTDVTGAASEKRSKSGDEAGEPRHLPLRVVGRYQSQEAQDLTPPFRRSQASQGQ